MDNSFQLVILQSGIMLLLTRPINKTNKNLIVAGPQKSRGQKGFTCQDSGVCYM